MQDAKGNIRMKAEILCVGTELLLGEIVNTNAAFIARELAVMGIDVYRQTVVGDNPERLQAALETAFESAEIVIMTGGLGPTFDDLTKETVASWFGLPMVMDQESLQYIEGFFKSRNLPMTENNKKQAMMPQGATVFPNPDGTAPGLAVRGKGKAAILLPGPPSEMVPMFQASVAPFLMQYSGKTILSHTIHLIGIGESALEDQLRELMEASKNPTIAPYAKTGEVRLRITASGKSREEAEARIAPVLEDLRGRLAEYVYGIDVGDLQTAAVDMLREKGMTVAVAESCTGGYVAKRLTDVPGASEVFECGAVTYANSAKERMLGVSAETLAAHGAVSEETAAEMAAGVRRMAGADFGISTTGIAGPDGGTEEKPVGLVYLGICSDAYTKVVKLQIGKGRKREYIREVAASNALRLLIEGLRRA